MEVHVQLFSYFKDLAGTAQAIEQLPDGSTVGDLMRHLHDRFPRLAAMDKSTLVAVGVEYAARDQILHGGDAVSLFPPVQGG